MNKAVILLSGGLDSTTCLALAKSQGYVCHALSFSYGQRHTAELDAAACIARHIMPEAHHVVNIDAALFQGTALVDKALAVPDFNGAQDIPITYVPARNSIFLAMALGYAESIEARDIFIGVSSVDYSHYPDCRPEFISAFEHMANLATKAGVLGERFTIHAPLQHLSKAQTIKLGIKLGIDYSMTISCYAADAKGAACGRCDSCMLRKKAFMQANVPDPTRYGIGFGNQ